MSHDLKLHELPPSPNNVKVRMALGYKGLAYERLPIDFDTYPGDRSALVKLSRQPLTPVLQHGDRVIFDSGAILRYLEANFPDTPPLFDGDYQKMKEIEKLEWFSRSRLPEPTATMFQNALSPEPDMAAVDRACSQMHELTGRLEDLLSHSAFLLGDRPTAADMTAGPYVALTMMSPDMPDAGPVIRFFSKHFKLGDGRARTRAWGQKTGPSTRSDGCARV